MSTDINPSEISELIKARIVDFEAQAEGAPGEFQHLALHGFG